MKLLLVEDEPELGNSVSDYLKAGGYLVEIADSFPAALEKMSLYEYDCFIVDINLPGGGNGFDLIRKLKQEQPQAAIIITSARNALDDRVQGLDLGADDYLTKPFYLPELVARLKALLRRRKFGGGATIVFHELTVDPGARSVAVQNVPLDLTPKEYDLLLYFLANQHRVLRRDSIAEHLLGDHADQLDDFNFIYSHIKNLRKKLQERGCGDYLQAVYGIGYKFTDKR